MSCACDLDVTMMEARKCEKAGTCNARQRPVMNIFEDLSSLVLRLFVFDVV